MSTFAIPVCFGCGHAVWPPRPVCARCGSSEWGEVPVDGGTVTETVDAAGGEGEPIRLATVRLHLPSAVPSDDPSVKRNSGARSGNGDGTDGPPVIARCEGCEVGSEVTLKLLEGALIATPK